MTRRAPFVVAHWGAYRGEQGPEGLALRPFESDPAPSPIGDAMLETLSGPLRIDAPMLRRGYLEGDGGAARGQDAFVAVGWDEALDRAANELARVRETHGAEAIYAGSYGWASAGRFHHAQSQLRRFFNVFGGCTRSRDSYSYAAGEVILPHVVAPMATLLAEHTAWAAIAARRSTVLALGGVSLRNAQVNSGGVARHTQAADIEAALAAGVEIVDVSPMRPEGVLRAAEHLSIRPGSDVALMLALAQVLVAEDLHDRAFLERCCVGFERFLPYLTGASDGVAKTPEWAAALTGLPAGTIRALARRLAAGPAVIGVSWSLTRQENGEQCYWMAVTLAAMLGGVGRPGEGFALGLAAVNGVGALRPPLSFASFPAGPSPTESFIPVARIADMLLQPGAAYRYDGQARRYPDIRLIYWAGGNPFHHHQDLNRLRRAWRKPEAVIVHEPHWTPLARHADIVLPATLTAERADIAGSPRDDHLFATEPVAAPHGLAQDDHAIFAALARRLAPPDRSNETLEAAFTEGRSAAEWIGRLYEETRQRMARRGQEMPSYERFREVGVHAFTPPAAPPTLLQEFRDDPDAHPLSTPSGRIEIFSAAIAAEGLEGQPGHPVWRAPVEWLGAPLATRFPLHLVTHQPARRLHSQLDHSAHSRAGRIAGRNPIVMHPADAARRGLAEGAVVRVFNDRGACLAGVRLDSGVREGVAMMETGAWLDLDPDAEGAVAEGLCRNGNPNMVTPDRATSEIAQGPAALSCLVEVEAVVGAPPPSRAYEPPEIIRS